MTKKRKERRKIKTDIRRRRGKKTKNIKNLITIKKIPTEVVAPVSMMLIPKIKKEQSTNLTID